MMLRHIKLVVPAEAMGAICIPFGLVAKPPIVIARERFGGPFCNEPGTRWTQNATPVLTRWLAHEPWRNQA